MSIFNRIAEIKEERRWKNRHLKEGTEWITKGYWDIRDLPSRHFLMDKIDHFSPISSVLEVGCNCGPNLYVAAKRFPSLTKIRGIDINPEAVKIGNDLLKEFFNVKLSVGKADNLKFADNSFYDVVFTNAVLVHIGPTKIETIIKEMLRVAKKGVLLMEWHQEGADPLGTRLGNSFINQCRWVRDYRELLKKFVREDQIWLYKIPPEVWPGDDWGKMGYVIEIVL